MKKVSRNDPCPCGSGKKYKQCCQQRGTHVATNGNPGATPAPTAIAHYNQGKAFLEQGNPEAAISSYRKALALKPDYAEAYVNLGNVLYEQGKLDEAVENFRNALTLKPSLAQAHYNMGNALYAQNKLGEAIESYRRTIALRPDFAGAHNNLGLALQMQGKPDDAIQHYRKALSLESDFVDAHTNLGNALNEQDKPAEAIASYLRALRLRASNESEIGFAQCVKHLSFNHEIAGIRSQLIRAISEPWGLPGDFMTPGISLIQLNSSIKACIDRAADAWPNRISGQDLFGPYGLASLANDQLLQCLLENAPVSDMGMERFLTMARFAMLDATAKAIVSDVEEEQFLPFYCALARQCFINEYVFAHTDGELERAKLLRERLASAMTSGSPFPLLWLPAVAAYFPMSSLPSAEALLDHPWHKSVVALLIQQVREPMEEFQLRANIPKLTAIEDEVSRLVQQQYEENPYPRWVKLPSGRKAACADAFVQFQSLGKGDAFDILVAGCGTGQHSILVAQQFSSARILAVDLSLTSLGYAKRKTQELGLKNVEYAQADIMKLAGIGRTFDIIESMGVLHHLANPMAGWRILLSLLRPGGFMRLGFYSELARQPIVAARRFIAERGYASNTEDIRRCRQDLMAIENDMQLRQLTTTRDFYGISACRDLIFNVQEHRYTLHQLKASFAELNLNFIGFSLEPGILNQYRRRFPDDLSQTNLDYWNIFENENPNMFFGMYQFWVQKRE